jgi:hypothetical protein
MSPHFWGDQTHTSKREAEVAKMKLISADVGQLWQDIPIIITGPDSQMQESCNNYNLDPEHWGTEPGPLLQLLKP